MSADMAVLVDYVTRATTVFRKGDVVTITGTTFQVITIDAFPALPDGATSTVDTHFVEIGFTKALAELDHREFYDLVLTCSEGAFQNMQLSDWKGGPSYIAIGGWIGDQTLAFRFMACVQAHGLGKVITPKMLHIEDEAKANQMAGMGYVMLSGLDEPAVVKVEVIEP